MQLLSRLCYKIFEQPTKYRPLFLTTYFEVKICSSIQMPISDIVSDLQVWRDNHPGYLEQITDLDGLIESLRNLDDLAEMNLAKETVVTQIKHLIINSKRTDAKFNGNMLNAVITGSPGVGKTELAKRLARVWKSMGLIKRSDKNDIPDSLTGIVANAIHAEYIETLSSELRNIKGNLIDTRIKLEETIDEQRELFDSLCRYQLSGRLKNNRTTNNIIKQVEKSNRTLAQLAGRYSNLKKVYPKEHIDDSKDVDDLVRVVNRDDFMAGYVGQTEEKTRKLLEDCRGKVMVIDEAYSLYTPGTNSSDPFGEIALTILNEFMSSHPDEIIVVFAGYKDKMEETIFKKQPGLRRRCMWTFDIEGYTSEGLSQIYLSQLKQHHFTINPTVDPKKFFNRHQTDFSFFGGDTEKLAYYSALAYSEIKYSSIMDGTDTLNDSVLDESMLEAAYQMFISNKLSLEEFNDVPVGMYI